MKIGISSDHQGYKRKEQIKKYLESQKIEVIDYGTTSEEMVDYTDYALLLTDALIKKEVDKGILVCGTGIGMSIIANKVKGIYCAKVDTIHESISCREHNDANVIALSSHKSLSTTKKIINNFINTKFLGLDRYNRRIEKIKSLEK